MLLLVSGCLVAGSVFAAPKEAAVLYDKAAKDYRLLFQDQKFQSLEANWLKTIGQFEKIQQDFKQTEEGAKALYTLGTLYFLLHSWNGKAVYQQKSSQAFQDFLKDYARHPLAKDALLALARNAKDLEKDRAKAEKLYEQVVKTYPNTEAEKSAKEQLALFKQQAETPTTNLVKLKEKQAEGVNLAGRILAHSKKPSTLLALSYYDLDDKLRIVVSFDQALDLEYASVKQAKKDVLQLTLHQASLAAKFTKPQPKDLVEKTDYKAEAKALLIEFTLANYSNLEVYDLQDKDVYKLVIDLAKIKAPPSLNSANQPEKAIPLKNNEPQVQISQQEKTHAEKKAPPKEAALKLAKTTQQGSTKATPPSAAIKASAQANAKDSQKKTSGQANVAHKPAKPALAQNSDQVGRKDQQKSVAAPVSKAPEEQASDSADQAQAEQAQLAAKQDEITEEMVITRSAKNLSLSKALGLKIKNIVLDAGHGGRDPGAVGGPILEKELTLEIVKLVAENLKESDLDLNLFFTRAKDRYISLEDRTAFANDKKADLFVSIHANSAENPKLRGIETYYLNLTADPYALSLAAKENTSSKRGSNELSSVLKNILIQSKRQESIVFAQTVQKNLLDQARSFVQKNPGDLGVKQAPFFVLIGAEMPSILIEVGFLSNKQENLLLRKDAYKNALAKGIAKGIANYIREINKGTRVVLTK